MRGRKNNTNKQTSNRNQSPSRICPQSAHLAERGDGLLRLLSVQQLQRRDALRGHRAHSLRSGARGPRQQGRGLQCQLMLLLLRRRRCRSGAAAAAGAGAAAGER